MFCFLTGDVIVYSVCCRSSRPCEVWGVRWREQTHYFKTDRNIHIESYKLSHLSWRKSFSQCLISCPSSPCNSQKRKSVCWDKIGFLKSFSRILIWSDSYGVLVMLGIDGESLGNAGLRESEDVRERGEGEWGCGIEERKVRESGWKGGVWRQYGKECLKVLWKLESGEKIYIIGIFIISQVYFVESRSFLSKFKNYEGCFIEENILHLVK